MFTRGLFWLSLLTATVRPAPSQEVLTNQAVLGMVRTLNEDTILDLFRLHKTNFVTTSEELMSLKRSGVSERIIQAMVSKNLVAVAKPDAPKSKVPQDNGVYYKKGDAWVEVLTESIIWTHSGVVNTVRSVASVMMLKPDYSGTIEQASSRTMLTSPFELMIVSNNADIHNYLLIQLKRTKNGREIDMGPAKKGEAFKHSISYGVEKMGPGQFKLLFPSPLAPGEYGIVEKSQIVTETEAALKDKGRVSTFRVLL